MIKAAGKLCCKINPLWLFVICILFLYIGMAYGATMFLTLSGNVLSKAFGGLLALTTEFFLFLKWGSFNIWQKLFGIFLVAWGLVVIWISVTNLLGIFIE
jgi:hypothetical protein